MKYTENFGLKKPEPTDFYNVEDFNENADIIEEALSERPTNKGDASNMTIEFTEASELVNLTSGEKLSIAMGKIARAIKGYMSHILIKGSTSGSGHVSLSDSSTVTDSTGLALPATEKNASISGTLANQMSLLLGNLTEIDGKIRPIIDSTSTYSDDAVMGRSSTTSSRDNNANYFYKNGIYETSTSTIDAADWGLILVLRATSSTWIWQIWFKTNGSVLIRRTINSLQAWTEWQQLH